MKKTLFIATALVLMVGCNKSLIETPVSESEYGYINLGITADTEMEVVTKSSPSETYRVKLEKKDGENWTNQWTEGWINYGALNATLLTVPAGTYRFTVENIDGTKIYDANHSNGQMYVKGTSAEFSVTSGKSVTTSVVCSIQNSKVVIKKGTNFDTYFRDSELEITAKTSSDAASATTFTMDWANAVDTQKYKEVYLPAGTSVIWRLKAVRKDSETSTTKYQYTNENKGEGYVVTTVQGKCTEITLTPSTGGNGVINVTISTDESYTDETHSALIDPIAGEVING